MESPSSQEVYQFLISKGLSPLSAAGLTGNFIVESGNFDPKVISGKRRGDSGTAYGIGQWRGVRQDNLFKFVRQNSLDVSDWRAQALFMLEESNPQSPYRDFGAVRARREAGSARNAREATAAWVRAERPAGSTTKNPYGAHSFNSRLEQAQLTLSGRSSAARSRSGAYTNLDGTPATGVDTRFGSKDTPYDYRDELELTTARNYANTKTNPLDFGSRPLENTPNNFDFGNFTTEISKNNPAPLTPADPNYNPFLDNPFNLNRNRRS